MTIGTSVVYRPTATGKPATLADRCLVNEPAGSRIWKLPDDYLQCVTGRLLDAFPKLRSASSSR